jgi:DNA invertase Pin-like site-specific DNA recombinase
MADASAGKLDVVAVWRFDRFARSTRHLLLALEEFRALDVDFVSVRESIDTSTPMGRMVFTMVAAVAELERELIRERVIAGIRRAQAEPVNKNETLDARNERASGGHGGGAPCAPFGGSAPGPPRFGA